MDVLLLNAPRLFFKGMFYGFTSPPLGLAYLTGYLESKGHGVRFLDMNTKLMKDAIYYNAFKDVDGNIEEELFQKEYKSEVDRLVTYLLKNEKMGQVIGISVLEAQSLKLVLPMLEEMKKRNPTIKIVVGGNSCALIDEKYIQEGTIDFVITGKGEDAFDKLLMHLDGKGALQDVKGIKYFNGDVITVNPEEEDFDITKQKIKFDKPTIDEYRYLSHYYDNYNDFFFTPVLPYSFSTGCTFNCTFCAGALDKKKHIHKSPKQIVSDLKKLVSEYGYKFFYFFNMHLNISPGFIDELCDEIIGSDLDILWSDSIKPLGNLSRETFLKLRKAGCIMLNIGIETGSEKIMKKMRKGHTVVDNHNALKYSHEAGIWNMVNFLVGFPGEGEEEFQETIQFVHDNQEYIDSIFTNTFRLEKNYIRLHPEEFGIEVASAGSLNSNSNVILNEYNEIDGMKYEELQKDHIRKMNELFQLFFEKYAYKLDILSHRMIFPLYEILKQKGKVRKFYTDNYRDLLQRTNTESVFLGANCNQNLPANLGNCSINNNDSIEMRDIRAQMRERINVTNRIFLVGHEPLIHPRIEEILKYARATGFVFIVLNTNARMLAYDDFANMVAQYVDEILVVAPENYDKISKVDESYDQMTKGIENWRKLGKKVRYYS